MTEHTDENIDAEIDELLAEHADAGRRLRWVIVTPNSWEFVDDPRTTEHGHVTSLLIVVVPEGAHYYAIPHDSNDSIRWAVDDSACLSVRRVPADRVINDSDLLVVYSPSGWLNIRSLTGTRTD